MIKICIYEYANDGNFAIRFLQIRYDLPSGRQIDVAFAGRIKVQPDCIGLRCRDHFCIGDSGDAADFDLERMIHAGHDNRCTIQQQVTTTSAIF